MKSTLGELLKDKGARVHRVAPGVSVAEAVDKMNRERVGAVLVMDEDALAGIFTERDVLVRVVGAERDPGQTIVRDVMTTGLVTVSPATTVEQAMVVCTEKRCRHLPVVDGGAVAGMVSIGDLTRWVTRHLEDSVRLLEDYISGGY